MIVPVETKEVESAFVIIFPALIEPVDIFPKLPAFPVKLDTNSVEMFAIFEFRISANSVPVVSVLTVNVDAIIVEA